MHGFHKSMQAPIRIVSTCLLMLSLVVTASAYTIVMRGGKRVDIPARFSVTNTTLTYEAAPGFMITFLLAAIDVPATERANSEVPGSLLGRAMKGKESAQTSENPDNAPLTRSTRSLTNRELEPFARVRVESERAYEKRLKELGLPPLAVLRAEAAADAERFWQEMARKREEREANQKAAELQAQVAALSAQLNYVQTRMGELPQSGDFAVLGGFPSFSSYGRSRVNRALFDVPPGLPVGGAFGSFNVGFGFPAHFRGLRRSVYVSPVQVRGRGRVGHGSHGRPRSR